MERKLTDFRKLALCFAIFAIGVTLAHGQQGRALIFADEFNSTVGATPDSAKWRLETGGQGWGNEELQFYDDKSAFTDGNGSLVIRAVRQDLPESFKCWYGNCQYTSARLNTKGRFDFKYGEIEARLKIPRGQGIWPAFWMLGTDIDKVGWPSCGEIDIMENIGREPKTVHGTIHGPGYSGGSGIGAPFGLGAGKAFADDFHVYSIDWKKNKIRWYVDGELYQTLTPKDLPDGKKWVFDHPFFIILNVAVGGNWGGRPDETSVFPQEMLVDYVRVYKQ